MEVIWIEKRRRLGDNVVYLCPPGGYVDFPPEALYQADSPWDVLFDQARKIGKILFSLP